MSFRLLPKDVKFFDLFVEDGENLQAAAVALRDMTTTRATASPLTQTGSPPAMASLA